MWVTGVQTCALPIFTKQRTMLYNTGGLFVLQGGIPKVGDTVQPLSREDLKGLPFKFPETIIRFADVLFLH